MTESRVFDELVLSTFENVDEGVFLVDAQMRLVFLNARCRELLGLAAAQCVPGASYEVIVAALADPAVLGVDGRELAERCRRLVAKGGRFAAERELANGCTVEWVTNPLPDGGAVTVLRDVTEARIAERLKREFLSSISHELRTPLTSIRGALGLLGGGIAGDLPEKARSLVDITLNNTIRLSQLINDILDMERIESGRLAIRLAPRRLATLVEQAVRDSRAMAGQNDVVIDLDIYDQDVEADVDGERQVQVVRILLSNAIKYSPSRGRVGVSVARTETRARISVSDRGPGVPAAFREHIFTKFSRADGSDARNKDGAGLGLTIAKAVIERFGGFIGYDNGSAGGATFYVDLPIATPALARDDLPDPATDRPRILCVEDDSDNVTLVRHLLGDAFELVRAGSVAAGRVALEETRWDLVILDLGLPDGSGLDLLPEIKAAGVPVLVYSARELAPAADAEVAAALVKSRTDGEELLRMIRELIRGDTRSPPGSN